MLPLNKWIDPLGEQALVSRKQPQTVKAGLHFDRNVKDREHTDFYGYQFVVRA